jgi:hypothetical protein
MSALASRSVLCRESKDKEKCFQGAEQLDSHKLAGISGIERCAKLSPKYACLSLVSNRDHPKQSQRPTTPPPPHKKKKRSTAGGGRAAAVSTTSASCTSRHVIAMSDPEELEELKEFLNGCASSGNINCSPVNIALSSLVSLLIPWITSFRAFSRACLLQTPAHTVRLSRP